MDSLVMAATATTASHAANISIPIRRLKKPARKLHPFKVLLKGSFNYFLCAFQAIPCVLKHRSKNACFSFKRVLFFPLSPSKSFFPYEENKSDSSFSVRLSLSQPLGLSSGFRNVTLPRRGWAVCLFALFLPFTYTQR